VSSSQAACDRIRALQAEYVEGKKFIESLLNELQAQHAALAEAHALLGKTCQAVKLEVEDVRENADDGAGSSSINIDPSTFTRVDEHVRAELGAHRVKTSRLLSDIVAMSGKGLDAFQARHELLMEQQQKLRTAEMRLEHQSETISDLKEKHAMLEAKLKSALQDSGDYHDALGQANLHLEQLKSEKKEHVASIIALKDTLAKALEQKQAIDADKGRLIVRVEGLENQLDEATRLADDRGQTLEEMASKMALAEELYAAHVEKHGRDNVAISQDLVKAHEASETMRSRCEQQAEVALRFPLYPF
jgi:chromosome segregation ATPase